jgi:lipopolysaccharide biosynthesis glycosyltransferase
MEVIGVTIGIGERHKAYAEKSIEAFERFTGIEARMIDDEMFSRYDFTHMSEHHNERTWIMKLYMFELFPDVENFIYFDCDWLATCHMDLKNYLNKKEFHCVRDRIYKDDVKQAAENIGKSGQEYFNAGFYIINRAHHKHVLEYAREIYMDSAKQWGDQCVTNRAVNDLAIPVLYLGREYNFMDYDPNSWAGQSLSINAIHTSFTYEVYDKNERLFLNQSYRPNRFYMDAAIENHYLEINGIECELLPDWFTSLFLACN